LGLSERRYPADMAFRIQVPSAIALSAIALSTLVLSTPVHSTSMHSTSRSTSAAPPAFARDGEGRAVDGQRVSQAPARRRQVVAILPDRTTGRDWGLRYLREAVKDLNRELPDAVFCVGDLVQGYSRDHAHVVGERKAYLDIAAQLSMPFYPTPGNHDLVSGKRTATDRSFADEYRAMFGPLYYSVELELASFVILNTEDGDGRIEPGFSDTQLAWLDKTLAELAARGKPIILLFHRPLWDHKPTRWDERVQPMLVKHGVDYVIAGHYHALQMLPPKDGIPFLLLGTCGGMIDQHPLAGQLQHLTFVDCTEGGALRVWHQPVGLVLPEDFVTRADQDRVWKLRESRTVRATGLARAAAGGDPRTAEATLEVRNPIDLPITLTLAPPGVISTPGRAPLWWTAGRAGRGTPGAPAGANGWTSHARADVDNPHTMPLDAAAEVDPAAIDAELAPGESRTLRFPVRLPEPDAASRSAPQLEVYATFTDGKGRTVPVWLPTRLPVERSVRAAPALDAAERLPALAWDYSPYDTREANPSVRVAMASDGTLQVEVEVPDELAAGAPAWTEPDDARRSNPHADAVRVIVSGERGIRDLLFEPFTPGGSSGPAGARCESSRTPAGGWSARIAVDTSGIGRPTALQVGVADNDDTFHTQWRWLAPRGAAGSWPLRP